MNKINMIGKKFGKLTVIEEQEERNKRKEIIYKCECECGNIVYVRGISLRNGSTKSCGCLKGEKHGKYKHRLYSIWKNMKNRCYNEKYYQYKDWGGRGIVVCDEWKHSFEAFYNWAMNNSYRDDLSIDRIDNDGNYKPSNCRWLTTKEQSYNRRSNVYLTYDGKTQTIMGWAKELNIKHITIYARRLRHKDWTDEQCLFGKRK